MEANSEFTRVATQNDLSAKHVVEPIGELSDLLQVEAKLKKAFASCVFFANLAPEIWSKISSFLTVRDLLQCERVSKRLKALTTSAWKSPRFNFFEISRSHFHFPDYETSRDEFVEGPFVIELENYLPQLRCVLERIGDNLKHLSFPSMFNWCWHGRESFAVSSVAVIAAIAQAAPRLQKLSFFDWSLTPSALVAIGRLAQLEALILEHTIVTLQNGDDENAVISAVFEESVKLAIGPLSRLKELRITGLFDRYVSSSVITSLGTNVQMLDIVVNSLNVSEFCEFLETRGDELVALTICALDVKKSGQDESILASLARHCSKLRNLDLVYHPSRISMDDVRLLHGLERLRLSGFDKPLSDDDVITICTRNPALRLINDCFNLRQLTKRAYVEGLARLECLERLSVGAFVQLDDSTFDAVVRSNASSLEVVVLDSQWELSVDALCSLGSRCSSLKEVHLKSGVFERASCWCSEQAMHEFANAVATSRAQLATTKTGLKVRVYVEESIERPAEMLCTGLVDVICCNTVVTY